jgi:hypothetical protein
MKNYSLHIVNDDDGNLFHCVFEEQTQQAYDFFYFLDDAKECIDFLESGGAFSGFTPAFILNEINIRESERDLNQKVNVLFNE